MEIPLTQWTTYDDVMISVIRLARLLIKLKVMKKYKDTYQFEKENNLLHYAERNWKFRNGKLKI